jgi:hypothetical protein
MLRGTVVVELVGRESETARQAVARAIAAGALGSGYDVSLSDDTVVFDGGVRTCGASRGRIRLLANGQAQF